MRRPLTVEYTSYHSAYVENVPYADVAQALHSQIAELATLLGNLTEARGGYRYEPNKWSAKELVGHVIDTERIFGYRCLAFARGETQPLPGFDEELYALASGSDGRSLKSLQEEFVVVRRSSLCLFDGLNEEQWGRHGTANEKRLTVRVMPWLMAGHAHHHFEVLRQRYL